MRKKLLPLALLFTFCKMYSQVGVNTTTPAATLDINAKNATGTSANVDGVLITRVDRQRAQSMTGVPTSTLVYVNSIATGTQTGAAVNMDAVGYYYYDGTAWVKIHNPTNSIAANIYNADGTLTGNRTVSQAGNTLAFTGTASNAFSVDNTTFSVDAANDRIGVGTTTPDTKLTVSTPDNSFGLNHTNGTVSLKTYIGGGAAFMGTTTAHNLNVMTTNAARVTITSGGDVGIGTAIPGAKLEVNSGTAGVSGLKFTNLNSASTVGTGQALGVDASGNVITVSTSTQAATTENAVNNPPGSVVFSVNDLGYTIVTGSNQSVTIPAGGKALFVNFMLGIDYSSLPAGGGAAFYQAILFIDNVATNVYQTTQESGTGAQAQFNLSCVKFLAAGSHTLNVRMIRKYNNGTTSGANMSCSPISISFNSTYID
ncbi:hypothetical protein [Chryseobacterium sp. T20]|uniref:hypothetical protein n=1 Tax=Chryseobacterium sp. T20 TaxID=3395375 RepID=UPI0039BCE784